MHLQLLQANTITPAVAIAGFTEDSNSLRDQFLKIKNNRYNHAGMIPIVGTGVAVGRFFYGLIKVIISIAKAIFAAMTNRRDNTWKSELKDGLSHMGRALVEAVPFFGGIILLGYDITRLYDLEVKIIRHSDSIISVLNRREPIQNQAN